MDYRYLTFRLAMPDPDTASRLEREFRNCSEIWNVETYVWENIMHNNNQPTEILVDWKTNSKNANKTALQIPAVEMSGQSFSGKDIIKALRDAYVPPRTIFMADNYNAAHVSDIVDDMYANYRMGNIPEIIRFNIWDSPMTWVSMNPANIHVSKDSSSDDFICMKFGNNARNVTLYFKPDEIDEYARIRPMITSNAVRAVYIFAKKAFGKPYRFYLVIKLANDTNSDIYPITSHDGPAVSILSVPDHDYICQSGGKIEDTDDLIQMYPDLEEYAKNLVFKIITRMDPKRIVIPNPNFIGNFPPTRKVLTSKTSVKTRLFERYSLLYHYLTKYCEYFNVKAYTTSEYDFLNCKYHECGKHTLKLSDDGLYVECSECDYKEKLLPHTLNTLADASPKKTNDLSPISDNFVDKFWLLDKPDDAIIDDYYDDDDDED